jgi:hypothetical protein
VARFDGRGEGDKDYRSPANRQNLGDPLRYLFDLSGKRLAPPEFDMDTFKAVYDMGAGGFAQYELQYAANSFGADGQNAPSTTIVSPSGNLGSNILTSKQRSADNIAGRLLGPQLEWETRLLTCTTTITLDAAGAVAMAGKLIDIFFFMDPIVGALGLSNTILFLKSAFAIAAGTLSYSWGIHGFSGLPTQNGLPGWALKQWDGWVPARQRLTSQLVVQDGTNFAANTNFAVTMTGACVPQGCQLPL